MKDLHLLHLQNKSKSEMSLSLEFGSDPFLLPRLLAGGPGLGHYGVDLSQDFFFFNLFFFPKFEFYPVKDFGSSPTIIITPSPNLILPCVWVGYSFLEVIN